MFQRTTDKLTSALEKYLLLAIARGYLRSPSAPRTQVAIFWVASHVNQLVEWTFSIWWLIAVSLLANWVPWIARGLHMFLGASPSLVQAWASILLPELFLSSMRSWPENLQHNRNF